MFLAESLCELTTSTSVDNASSIDQPILILGDFNYHAASTSEKILGTLDTTDEDIRHNTLHTNHSSKPSTNYYQQKWHHLLTTNFHECTHSREEGPLLPTFRRGTTQSTIDYIFSSPYLFQHLHSSSIDFIYNQWTDHALSSTKFIYTLDHQGPGLWRANPQLANNLYFISTLFRSLDDYFILNELPTDLDNSTAYDSQYHWYQIKTIVRNVALHVGRRRQNWYQRQILRLQRKRNRLLRKYKTNTSSLIIHVPFIENRINSLQCETATNQIIRAGRNCRKNSERSAGFLKRTIETKASRRNIINITHPTTLENCTTFLIMQDTATIFYKKLYTPDVIV